VYVVSPSVLERASASEPADMPELIDRTVKSNGLVCVHDIGDQWIDMGQISDYERAIDLIEKWKT
jgi:NDP-sugar pyrophosphorylase family protein